MRIILIIIVLSKEMMTLGGGGGLNRIMWECELFSRGLIMSTGHCKEFSKPIFQALVFT